MHILRLYFARQHRRHVALMRHRNGSRRQNKHDIGLFHINSAPPQDFSVTYAKSLEFYLLFCKIFLEIHSEKTKKSEFFGACVDFFPRNQCEINKDFFNPRPTKGGIHPPIFFPGSTKTQKDYEKNF